MVSLLPQRKAPLQAEEQEREGSRATSLCVNERKYFSTSGCFYGFAPKMNGANPSALLAKTVAFRHTQRCVATLFTSACYIAYRSGPNRSLHRCRNRSGRVAK